MIGATVAMETWTVVEILFGGSRRKLAEHLTATQKMAWHCPDGVWNVVWVLELPTPHPAPPNYHPEA